MSKVFEPGDFADCTVFFSLRSPFARRVRVALLERGIPFQERAVDTMRPNAEVIPHNLVSRVPTVVLKSGESLAESNLILQLLDPIPALSRAELLKTFRWSAFATGVMEKTVENYLELLRPEGQRDREVFEEIRGIFDRFLEGLDRELAGRFSLIEGKLTQADYDAAIAMTYLKCRYPEDLLSKYPQLEAFRLRLESRPSFKKTAPPL